MKPPSPLSLLLFLHLVTALPLPSRPSFFNHGLRTALLQLRPSTPPTKLAEPHFPSHQLSTSTAARKLLLELVDNEPQTPSSNTPPSEALSAKEPLSSAYLLHLSTLSHPDATRPLPSKPTSELPALRKEEATRYWESNSPSEAVASVTIVEIHPAHTIKLCGHGPDRYFKIQGAYLKREYSDLMVVGIVVLFLAVVVALEACERVGDLRHILCGTRKRRGEIYLPDNDEILIIHKPFYLQPAPPPRSKSSPTLSQPQTQTIDSAAESESDASEKA